GVVVKGGSGVIGFSSFWGGPSNVTVINQGVVGLDRPGTITFTGGTLTNQGTLQATAGGTVNVQPTTVTNFSAGVLTGGTWKAAGGPLRVLLGSPIVTNAASIVLDGPGSNFYRDSGTTGALTGLATNAAGGSFTIQNGFSFTTAGDFANAGAITVG